jgi:hypothetical protein
VVLLSGSRVADATVAQHVVTLRQFYEYQIRAGVRCDPVNPLRRGGVVHVNVTANPTAAWVWRQIIEATYWGTRPRHLLRDRDAV